MGEGRRSDDNDDNGLNNLRFSANWLLAMMCSSVRSGSGGSGGGHLSDGGRPDLGQNADWSAKSERASEKEDEGGGGGGARVSILSSFGGSFGGIIGGGEGPTESPLSRLLGKRAGRRRRKLYAKLLRRKLLRMGFTETVQTRDGAITQNQ